jgi:hypothetical protein
MTPSDEDECRKMLTTAYRLDGPSAVRYPRGGGTGVAIDKRLVGLPVGKGEIRRRGKAGGAARFWQHADARAGSGRRTRRHGGQHALRQTDRPRADPCPGSGTFPAVSVEENALIGGAGSEVARVLEEIASPTASSATGNSRPLHRSWRPGAAAGRNRPRPRRHRPAVRARQNSMADAGEQRVRAHRTTTRSSNERTRNPTHPGRMADVQGSADTRQIAINKVGIKAIRHPVKVLDKSGGIQHTIAMFNMYVGLPHNFKGTHMSRFVEILNSHEREISVENFPAMLREMVDRLEAETGHIEMSFPYFINKAAPVSGVQSLMDYDVTLIGEICRGRIESTIKVAVPVTSLCPCSKEISERGAHNQRSQVTVTVSINDHLWIEELVQFVEGRHPASSTACSSARTRSTSPNVLTTTRSSSRTWCATSRRASTPSSGSMPMWSSPRTSSRSTIIRRTR